MSRPAIYSVDSALALPYVASASELEARILSFQVPKVSLLTSRHSSDVRIQKLFWQTLLCFTFFCLNTMFTNTLENSPEFRNDRKSYPTISTRFTVSHRSFSLEFLTGVCLQLDAESARIHFRNEDLWPLDRQHGKTQNFRVILLIITEASPQRPQNLAN